MKMHSVLPISTSVCHIRISFKSRHVTGWRIYDWYGEADITLGTQPRLFRFGNW